MSLATSSGQPLQYFIHDDYDAFRIEISGSLVGRAAQKAYEAWRTASLMARRQTRVIDISYVTEADEHGRAALRAWHEQDARIVASSLASRMIADSILTTTAPTPLPRRPVLDRLASLFARRTARIPADAEALGIASAGANEKNAENARVLVRGEMEERVR
jgi:hypothetical protein